MTMNIWKRLTTLVITATFLSLQVHPAVLADDSDIFGANIQPNVMIMIDDSGSMADSAPSNTFDVPPPSGTAAYYPVLNNCDPTGKPKVYQACDSVKVYKSGSANSYTFYANSVSAITGTGSAAAQAAINSLLDSVQGVRFGVMTFHYDSTGNGDGATVVAQIGSSVSSMKSAVNNLSPTGNTPLGDALYDVGQYYKGLKTGNGTQGPFTSPIQLACQPNFVIFITDGMQTAGTRLMPAEATNRYTQDQASWLPDTPNIQNVIVHTVGFGVTVNTTAAETQAAYDTLSQSARNGGGQFYISDNETQLQRALQDAIRRIVQATFTFATPVVPTTSTTGSTKAYLAAFRSDPSSPFWQGYLKAYQRDANGLVPVYTS